MNMHDDGYVVRLEPTDYTRLEGEIRGKDMTGIYEFLEVLATSRSAAIARFGSHPNSTERDVLQQILSESRASESLLFDFVRRVHDSMHAEEMQSLASVSNDIAGRAETTSKTLRNWTVVLAFATVVLALATIALVRATLKLD